MAMFALTDVHAGEVITVSYSDLRTLPHQDQRSSCRELLDIRRREHKTSVTCTCLLRRPKKWVPSLELALSDADFMRATLDLMQHEMAPGKLQVMLVELLSTADPGKLAPLNGFLKEVLFHADCSLLSLC